MCSEDRTLYLLLDTAVIATLRGLPMSALLVRPRRDLRRARQPMGRCSILHDTEGVNR